MKKYMVITVLSVAVLGMTSCGTKQENTKAEDSSSIIEVSASSEKSTGDTTEKVTKTGSNNWDEINKYVQKQTEAKKL